MERYVEEVKPDFLCTDYYPYFEPWNQYPFANRLNVHTEGRGIQSMDNCESSPPFPHHPFLWFPCRGL